MIPILVVNRPGQLVSLRFIFNVGSTHERQDEHGIAHFVEHMAFTGTRAISTAHVAKEMARLGEFNAYTTYDRTVYYCTCLKENLFEAFELMVSMLFLQNDDRCPEIFQREKSVIGEEISSRADDGYTVGWDKMYEVYGGTVFHPVTGTAATVKAITEQQYKQFIQSNYHGGNLMIHVTGDVDTIEAVDDINESLEDLVTGQTNVIHQPNRVIAQPPIDVVHQNQQSSYMRFYELPGEPNESDRYVMLSALLGGGMHSMLFERIRNQLGLVYWVGAGQTQVGHQNGLFIGAKLAKDNITQLRTEIDQVLVGAVKNACGDLFDTTKKNVTFGFHQANDSLQGMEANNDAWWSVKQKAFDPQEYLAIVQGTSLSDMQGQLKEMLSHPCQELIVSN